MALVRPHYSGTYTPFNVLISIIVLVSSSFFTLARAQGGFVNNGQFFTAGLAIGDAPQQDSPQHAGSNLVIAIELSGDGKIPQSAFAPGSGQITRYDSFELYLVSSQTNLNVTVSNASALLSQEPGSTVKHLNWPIPSCIAAGNYNLTFYEGSHINGEPFFSITPLRITIDNTQKGNNSCFETNPLQDQPQASSPPPVNAYSPSNQLATGFPSGSVPPITAGPITYTIGSAGLPSGWIIETSGQTPIITVTKAITTATVVIASMETITTTLPAQNIVSTLTETVLSTVTAIIPTGDINNGGFLPINGAHGMPKPSFILVSTIGLLFMSFALLLL